MKKLKMKKNNILNVDESVNDRKDYIIEIKINEIDDENNSE